MQNNTVAQTILAQIGGGMFVTMTGSRNLLDGGNYLSMKLGSGTANKATHLTITLDADDTYEVKFQRVWGTKVTEKGLFKGVYADMLCEIISSETGFFLRLV
jgi:hypothetical protein